MEENKTKSRRGVWIYRPDYISSVHLLSPYDMLRNLKKEMDRMEKGECCLSWDNARRGPYQTLPEFMERYHSDLFDEGENLRLAMEMPGCSKEDITLEVGEEAVHVTACIKEARRVLDSYCVECGSHERTIERRIALPQKVDPDAVRARYRNGVLEVILPKAVKEPGRKKIAVD